MDFFFQQEIVGDFFQYVEGEAKKYHKQVEDIEKMTSVEKATLLNNLRELRQELLKSYEVTQNIPSFVFLLLTPFS